jgi:D-galactarolactone cycloisomerase
MSEPSQADFAPSNASPRIVDVSTIAIRVPLEKRFAGSYYSMTHRSTVIVRVLCDDGTVGEAYAGDEDATLEQIDAVIHDEIKPLVVGSELMAVERTWEAARVATFDILRDRRIGLVACAGVDTAIWDAVGKFLDQPLWRLWGGYTGRVATSVIGAYYRDDLTIEAEVEALVEWGVAGMKVKVGGLSPVEDAQRFKRARRAAGDGLILMADANQAWHVSDAVEFARRATEDDLFWFEEPCRWDVDRLAMSDVRMLSGVSICAGQSELSAGGCRELMAQGAIDFCNFDSSWSGGPTEWRRVAAMSLAYGVRMAHHEEPQVSLHLLASISNGTFVEMFWPERDPIWHHLVANPPELIDGYLHLTERPGLGWELDGEYIEAHRIDKVS